MCVSGALQLEPQWTDMKGDVRDAQGVPFLAWRSPQVARPNIFMDAYSLATVGRLHCSHAAAEATNLAEKAKY